MQTGRIPTGNLERPFHNFPENQILTFLWKIGNREQAQTVADRFSATVVALVVAKFSPRETRDDFYRVEMPNGTGNFRNFQISRKKDNLERLTKICESNFRKLSVPFDLEQEFSEFWSNGTRPFISHLFSWVTTLQLTIEKD